jgi:signal transduction histidine kinase
VPAVSGAELWLLRLMAERGLRVLDASGLLILMSYGADLEVVAESGNAHPRVRSLPVPGTALGDLYRASESLSLVRPGSREVPWLGELGLDRVAAVLVEPVPLEEQPGLMIAARSEPPAFDRNDATSASDLARTIAERVLAERSSERERLRHGVRARELERAHWARELHDETVQDLGALRLLLAGARREDDVEELQHVIDAAVGHVDREVDALRHLITALRPAALDDLGLVAALEALARRAGAVEGLIVETEISVDGEIPRLDPEVESAIYRITQEALTNAAKHSGANRAVLALRREGDRLTAEVIDDGAGFSADSRREIDADRLAGPAHGVGLEGMRERAELVGAELEVSSRPGSGTTVRVSVPVRPG